MANRRQQSWFLFLLRDVKPQTPAWLLRILEQYDGMLIQPYNLPDYEFILFREALPTNLELYSELLHRTHGPIEESSRNLNALLQRPDLLPADFLQREDAFRNGTLWEHEPLGTQPAIAAPRVHDTPMMHGVKTNTSDIFVNTAFVNTNPNFGTTPEQNSGASTQEPSFMSSGPSAHTPSTSRSDSGLRRASRVLSCLRRRARNILSNDEPINSSNTHQLRMNSRRGLYRRDSGARNSNSRHISRMFSNDERVNISSPHRRRLSAMRRGSQITRRSLLSRRNSRQLEASLNHDLEEGLVSIEAAEPLISSEDSEHESSSSSESREVETPNLFSNGEGDNAPEPRRRILSGLRLPSILSRERAQSRRAYPEIPETGSDPIQRQTRCSLRPAGSSFPPQEDWPLPDSREVERSMFRNLLRQLANSTPRRSTTRPHSPSNDGDDEGDDAPSRKKRRRTSGQGAMETQVNGKSSIQQPLASSTLPQSSNLEGNEEQADAELDASLATLGREEYTPSSSSEDHEGSEDGDDEDTEYDPTTSVEDFEDTHNHDDAWIPRNSHQLRDSAYLYIAPSPAPLDRGSSFGSPSPVPLPISQPWLFESPTRNRSSSADVNSQTPNSWSTSHPPVPEWSSQPPTRGRVNRSRWENIIETPPSNQTPPPLPEVFLQLPFTNHNLYIGRVAVDYNPYAKGLLAAVERRHQPPVLGERNFEALPPPAVPLGDRRTFGAQAFVRRNQIRGEDENERRPRDESIMTGLYTPSEDIIRFGTLEILEGVPPGSVLRDSDQVSNESDFYAEHFRVQEPRQGQANRMTFLDIVRQQRLQARTVEWGVPDTVHSRPLPQNEEIVADGEAFVTEQLLVDVRNFMPDIPRTQRRTPQTNNFNTHLNSPEVLQERLTNRPNSGSIGTMEEFIASAQADIAEQLVQIVTPPTEIHSPEERDVAEGQHMVDESFSEGEEKV